MAEIAKVLRVGKGFIEVEYTNKKRYSRSGGTVAWRCNNPGNLKFGEFAKMYGAVGHDSGGHAVFPCVEDGENAHAGLLFGVGSRYFNMTLQKAISIYAPQYDGNDPDAYVQFLLKDATYKKTKKLYDFTDEEKNHLLKRMRLMEGYKVGKETQI